MSIQDLTNTTWVFNSQISGLDSLTKSINGSMSGGGYTISITTIFENSQWDRFYNFVGSDAPAFFFYPTYGWYYRAVNGGDRIILDSPPVLTIYGGTDAADSVLISWLEANATQQVGPTVTIDLSTLSGWANVSSGTHSLTIVAKANGYRDSNPSQAVSVTKAAAGYTVSTDPSFYGEHDGQAYVYLIVNGTDSYDITTMGQNQTIATGVSTVTFSCNAGQQYLYYTMGGSSGVLQDSGSVILTDNFVITHYNAMCLTGDTLVTMADDSKKRIDEIELGEYVLSFDWRTLEKLPRKVIFTDKDHHHKFTEYDVWSFDNGTVIKTVHPHEFYNVEAKRFMYMTDWRIGDHAICENGTITCLIYHETVTEEVEHFKITLEGSTNFFANGLLTGDRNCPKDIDFGYGGDE